MSSRGGSPSPIKGRSRVAEARVGRCRHKSVGEVDTQRCVFASENSLRGACAGGPASSGGCEQAASRFRRTALKAVERRRRGGGWVPRSINLKEQKTRSLLRARRRPGPTDQAALKAGRPRGNRASRSPSCSSRSSDWRVCDAPDQTETPGFTVPKTFERSQGAAR